jgi:carboxylesterase
MVRLTNSYHVATLDHDADLIFERTMEFARTVAGEAADVDGAPGPSPS